MDIWDHDLGQPPEEINYCDFCGRSSERFDLEETNEGFLCASSDCIKRRVVFRG